MEENNNEIDQNSSGKLVPEIIEDHNPQNPELEEMEVHHHAHHHEKRNWHSYVWEFVMLFLAVFCGFLAEYQLEHTIERERVKKYMHDMVVNLKQDTIRIRQALVINEMTGKGLDSLRDEISVLEKGKGSVKRIYRLQWQFNSINGVLFNKSALKQLESSGSLRLVKNDELVNDIHQYYDRKVVAAEVQHGAANDAYKQSWTLWREILDMSYWDKSLRVEVNYGKRDAKADAIFQENFNSLPDSISLLDSDPKKLRALYNSVAVQELNLKGYNAFLRWADDDARKLIKRIEEEYNF